MLYFHITRVALILWSMLMISAIESVAIRTEGQVELESTSRNTYAKVLTVSVGSFLGDFSYRVAKSRRKKEGKAKD